MTVVCAFEIYQQIFKINVNSDKTKKKLLKSLMDKNVICLKCIFVVAVGNVS